MASGRKSLKDEIGVLRRFEQLSPKVFNIIDKMLDSKSKQDRLWAMDWLKNGFAKMIPQKIGGDPDNQAPIPIYGNFSIQGYNSNKESIQPD